jgi:hypothetical protein
MVWCLELLGVKQDFVSPLFLSRLLSPSLALSPALDSEGPKLPLLFFHSVAHPLSPEACASSLARLAMTKAPCVFASSDLCL